MKSKYSGGDEPQPVRWRCLEVGCNPILNEQGALTHKELTDHRVAKWPVRSKAGKAKAKKRSETGYYDQYNVGLKSAAVRAPFIKR